MKKTVYRILLLLVISFTIIGSQKRCLDKVEEVIRQDTIEKYNETVQRQSSEIEKSFAQIYKSLNTISSKVDTDYQNDDDCFNISYFVARNTFETGAKKAFFLDLDGNMYTSYAELEDYRDSDLYKKSLEGEEFFCLPFNEIGHVRNKVVSLVEPVYDKNGELKGSIGLIFTTYQLNGFTGQLSNEQNGYLYLVSSSGEIISSPLDDKMNSIFSYIDKNDKEAYNLIKKAINSKEPTNAVFEKSGDLITTAKIEGINASEGICAIKLVPIETIMAFEEMASRHVLKMITITTTLVIVLLAYVFYIIFTKNKSDKNLLRELAYVDLETGGKNFQYFNNELLDEKYKDGFIVALDIREFKTFEKLYRNVEQRKILSDVYHIIEDSISKTYVLAHEQSDQYGLFIGTANEKELEEELNKINTNLAEYSKNNSYPELSFYYGIRSFNHVDKPSELYGEAKNALKENKHDKSNIFHYHKGLGKNEEERNRLIVSAFENFIYNKNFYLEFQPKFDNKTGKVVGAEAFVRLKLMNGTIMYPDDFVKTLEDAGVIAQLDNFVFTSIVDLISKMARETGNIIPISMNISNYTLYQSGLPEQWAAYASESRIHPGMIPLEIKDEHLDSETKLIQVIDELKKYGFNIHIDKFGAGSSSLMSLSKVNLDVVKLDKSLIDKIGDFRSEMVLRHIVSLANDLRIKVIAFGVENNVQAKFVKEIGVSMIQGPYYSSPLAEDDFIEILVSFYDVNLNIEQAFEMLTRSVMLSTFASPKLGDKEISAMTGPILELGLKDDEIYLMGCNINAASMFKINLDSVTKSKEYRCVREFTYDDDYVSLKEVIEKTIETKVPQVKDIIFRKDDYTIYIECRLFYKSEIFGYKEVYLFAREKKNDTSGNEIINQLPGGLLVYRPNDNHYITLVNDELVKMMECESHAEFDELYDKKLTNFIYEQDYHVVMNSMFIQFFSSDDKNAHIKFRVKKKSGKLIYVNAKAHYEVNNIYGDLVYCYIESLEGQNEYELQTENNVARLQYESTHDGLTGLVNQASVKDLVSEVFENNPNTEFALMVMDIDDFKQVNDKHGHSFGDTVIKTFASALSSCVSRPGLCARIGGDEFVALEPVVKENVEQAAERFYNALHFTLGECVISPSIGVTTTTLSKRKYADMFLDADKALYTSKNVGKDTFTIYEPASHTEEAYRKDETRKDTFDTAQITLTVDKLSLVSKDNLFVLDLRANKLHLTSGIEKIFRVSACDIEAQDFLNNTVFESDKEMLNEEIAKIKKGIKEEHDLVYRLVDLNGDPVWVKCKGRIIKNQLKPWCIVGSISVITK